MPTTAPERVTFTVGDNTLVGHLFGASSTPKSGVIVTGSWTTVKEQMSDLYAAKLADVGFVVLTFDFSGWGESGGAPRDAESPSHKIVDIVGAAAWFAEQPFVAGRKIGGLAICASAGYMAAAIGEGAPIAAFATVAAWLHDAGTVGEAYGGAEGVEARRRAGVNARELYEKTGEVGYVPAFSDSDPAAGMGEAVGAYYGDPRAGAVPEWPNRLAILSWPEWLTFDGVSKASGVGVPTLMIHSEDAAFPNNARRFADKLPGPHEIIWQEGAQIDFYYQSAQVDPAVQEVSAHLRRALKSPIGGRA